MNDFLLELGTEEIPAGYIQSAMEQGSQFLQNYLAEHRLSPPDPSRQSGTDETPAAKRIWMFTGRTKIATYYTPRRMVFHVTGLPEVQADINKEISGPPVTVAYDKNHQPTQAFYGFLKRNNISDKDVQVKDTPKGQVCYARVQIKGAPTAQLLVEGINELVKAISWPKSMWWDRKDLTFARPLRYILALFNDEYINIQSPGPNAHSDPNGLNAKQTRGHQYVDYQKMPVKSADFNQYQELLRSGYVIVDQAERKKIIEQGIQAIAQKYDAVCDEPSLVDEVVNLVEYPSIIECQFDEEYLKLPAAVIESAMKLHQRYFPMKDKNGQLLARFVVVSNNPDCQAAKNIGEGNERVIKARLADAFFFWTNDRKIPLAEYARKLDSISFLGKAGNLLEKSKRLESLALNIAHKLGHDYAGKESILKQAAQLCKADLLTGMVGEFPDLQGVIGYEYLKDTNSEVAQAIKEHYQPRSASDALPVSPAGICLSLAEKFDNIVACFGLGLEPTGSQDPYGLKRQARAIIDIIRQNRLSLLIRDKINSTTEALVKYFPPDSKNEPLVNSISVFFNDRLSQIYRDEGYAIDLINAVLANNWDNILEVDNKIKTLHKLSQEKDGVWNELVEVVERTYNISKKAPASTDKINEALLQEKEEQELYRCYKENKDRIQELIHKESYEEASRLYARVFAKPAHVFFDKVFVNVENQSLRNNRILLNQRINQLYKDGIADLSKIPRTDKTARDAG